MSYTRTPPTVSRQGSASQHGAVFDVLSAPTPCVRWCVGEGVHGMVHGMAYDSPEWLLYTSTYVWIGSRVQGFQLG